MTRRNLGLLLVVTIALAACAASPTFTKRPGPGHQPTAAPPTAADGGSSGSPLVPPTPDGTPSPTGCPPYPETSGPWPSDRLVGTRVVSGAGGPDMLEFEFGPGSRPGAVATATTRETRPPFTQAGSGETVEVVGRAFYEFRFDGMLLADDSGAATYRGSRDLRTGMAGIRHVVIVDAFEGVLTFVVGTTGGCPWFETAPAAGAIRFYAGGPTP
jgi:hypothetical protein